MKTVWKFPFQVEDDVTIQMPVGAKVLCVQCQSQTPCIWALVDTENQHLPRAFKVRGTGHPCDGLELWQYIGTFQQLGGALVFHLFEQFVPWKVLPPAKEG